MEQKMATVDQPLTLPCGATIKNRLGKSAMSEALGTIDNRPTRALPRLYGRWADGGIGLCITGNVMVDGRALGEPNNVVVEDDSELELLREWARAGTRNETQLWAQLNHPGKQVPKGLNAEAVAPSAVPFNEKMRSMFETPRELSEAEIEEIIARFGRSARVLREAGFRGVQIHGAHGYLVSQFLSPKHNTRSDRWGGSAEARMRFVIAVFAAIRDAVGDDFPVGIKLNSADFQRGGFAEEESLDVISALSEAGIDLIEISGGTYEAPVMSGAGRKGEALKESTRQREAYFLEFAERARQRTDVPLMVTGGFRSRRGMVAALESGAMDIVGLARPLAVDPELPRKVLNGEEVHCEIERRKTGLRAVDRMAFMEVLWYSRQLARMGQGREPWPEEPPLYALAATIASSGLRTFRTRRLRASGVN